MGRRHYLWVFVAIAGLALVLGACGPSEEVLAGEEIFQVGVEEEGVMACGMCHRVDGRGQNAPPLDGIAGRAANEVAGLSAEEYLHQSIVDPNVYLIEGYDIIKMPPNYGEKLSENDINNLIAYMLTLE